jgi:hypothetical protein
VFALLEVEHGHLAPPARHELARQGRLADLACPEDGHHRELPQQGVESAEVKRASDHDPRVPGNLSGYQSDFQIAP